MWRNTLTLFLVAAVSVLLRSGIVSIPLERDEGAHAYTADRWLRGAVPYRDAFVHKPPGIYLAYAALLATGFRSAEAIHWLGHAFVLGTLAFLFLIGNRPPAHHVGTAAALAMTVLVLDGSVLGNTTNTEVLAILPLTAGVFFASRAAERGGLLRSFAAGVCGGLALMFKQVTAPVVFLMGAWIFWKRRTRAQALAFVEGLGLVLLPLGFYFWRAVGPATLFDALVGYNVVYGQAIPLSEYAGNLWSAMRPILGAQWPLLAAAMLGAATVHPSRVRSLALAWWLASFLAVALGGRFFQHYFVLLAPPTALLAALGLQTLGRRLTRQGAAWRGAVTGALTAAAVGWPVLVHWHLYWAAPPAAAGRNLHGLNPFPESPALGRWLRDRSHPDDTVFVYGAAPQLLYYTERRSATRYVFLDPLFGGGEDARARETEVLDELRRSAPRFVIIVTLRNPLGATLNAPKRLEQELHMRLAREYRPLIAEVADARGNQWIRPRRRTDYERAMFAYQSGELPILELWERRAASGMLTRPEPSGSLPPQE